MGGVCVSLQAPQSALTPDRALRTMLRVNHVFMSPLPHILLPRGFWGRRIGIFKSLGTGSKSNVCITAVFKDCKQLSLTLCLALALLRGTSLTWTSCAPQGCSESCSIVPDNQLHGHLTRPPQSFLCASQTDTTYEPQTFFPRSLTYLMGLLLSLFNFVLFIERSL